MKAPVGHSRAFLNPEFRTPSSEKLLSETGPRSGVCSLAARFFFFVFFAVFNSVPHAKMCHARLESLLSSPHPPSVVAAGDRQELQPKDWPVFSSPARRWDGV